MTTAIVVEVIQAEALTTTGMEAEGGVVAMVAVIAGDTEATTIDNLEYSWDIEWETRQLQNFSSAEGLI